MTAVDFARIDDAIARGDVVAYARAQYPRWQREDEEFDIGLREPLTVDDIETPDMSLTIPAGVVDIVAFIREALAERTASAAHNAQKRA